MDVESMNNDEHSTRMNTNNHSIESDLNKFKNSMPTIYPNDYDFNAIGGFGLNSTTSRSFVRPAKAFGQEHRNISVPNSLKVCLFLFFSILKKFLFFVIYSFHTINVCYTFGMYKQIQTIF